jgi:hypothetical protein
MIYYTYLWLRERDSTFPAGTPYYAGKGSGNRAFVKGNHFVPCPKNPENIIIQEWPSEEESIVGEILLIAIYGRIDLGTGCLRNLTDGGDGLRGVGEETRARLRKSHIGRRWSKEDKERIYGGRSHGPETRNRMRQSHLGQKRSPETRARIREVTKKENLSPITIERRRIAALKDWERRKKKKV